MSTSTELPIAPLTPAPAEPPRSTHDIPLGDIPWRVETESRYEGQSSTIPLEEIQRERTKILPRLRALRARYGSQGTMDAQRKAYRSAIALELRAGPPPAGAKGWTDTLLEMAASADDRYREWLDTAETERAELQTLEVAMTHLEESFNRGQAEMRLAQAEWLHTGRET